MSETIFTIVAISVFVIVAVMVVFLWIQQSKARPQPGDDDDLDPHVSPHDIAPSVSEIQSKNPQLPGPGNTGYGTGGRMGG